MNKSLFIMLIALFSILSFNEAKGQCDAGWTPDSRIISICGCPFTIEFCYKCNIAYPSQIKITKFTRPQNCIPGCTESEVFDKIQQYLSSPLLLIELCGTPGPCPDYGVYWQVNTPICWYKELVYDDWMEQNEIICQPCSGDVCIEAFMLCFDLETNTYKKMNVVVWEPITNNYDCDPVNLNDPINLNEPTECYHYNDDKCWKPKPE